MHACVLCGDVETFQLLAAVSVFFIFISITSFCLKTHPAMRVPTVGVQRTTLSRRRNNTSTSSSVVGVGVVEDGGGVTVASSSTKAAE